MPLLFGDCELIQGARVLRRSGAPVPLSPKAFQLLTVLLDERPRALSKEAIFQRLWPDTFVSDASLHNLVAELRAALSDHPRSPRFIRTLHRYGYAFHGPAIDTDSDDAFPEEAGGSLFWGTKEGGQAMLEDLGSKNGTNVNGARIEGSVPLQDGDEIRVGAIELTYRSHSHLRSTRSFAGT